MVPRALVDAAARAARRAAFQQKVREAQAQEDADTTAMLAPVLTNLPKGLPEIAVQRNRLWWVPIALGIVGFLFVARAGERRMDW